MKQLGRWLAYIQRAKQHASTVNAALLFIILLQTSGVGINLWLYFVIVIATVLLFVVVGYVDTKIGIRKMEQLDHSLNNPVLMEILEDCKYIKSKL